MTSIGLPPVLADVGGLEVPAGVASHTGVAGLALGGGMGWLSRRFGLTIDSLLAVDLVTAEDQSRRASAETDPDLFWAIRGGGGSFGAVTRFDFKMHELGPVVIGKCTYSVAEASSVLQRLNDLARVEESFALLFWDWWLTWSGNHPQLLEQAHFK